MSKRNTTAPGVRRGGSNKRLGYGALVSTAAFGMACQGLLGVEDVHQGPPPGAGAGGTSGGKGGTGGTGGSNGGSAGKGSGGKGGAGGTTGGSSGTGGKGGTTGGSSGTGGDSGEGGSDTGGTSGTGGSTGGAGGSGGTAGSGGSNAGSGGSAGSVNTDPTVRGKVVNHWLHPIPNVPVMIGDAMTTTDDDGEFEIPDVEATYDAQLVLTFSRYGSGQEQYGWVYEGLTRRDPTLQVYWGLPLHSADHQITIANAPSEANAVVVSALGGEYHNWARESATGVQTSTDWYGPSTVTMMGHGLSWLETNGLPTSFTAYTMTSSPIALSDTGGQAMWTLDFTPNSVAAGAIGGTVTSASTDYRDNRAFVQFTSGAVIELFDHYGTSLTANFTYTVPTLPGASITLSASEGPGGWGALGVAHVDNLAAGATAIALDIPTPPVITAPPDGTTLSASSVLSWTPGTHDTYVFRAISDNYYEGLFVVTARTQINIPTFSNGFALRPGDAISWRLETHGTAQNVDELAGANGFADAFAYGWGEYPEGPRRESGSMSLSQARGFIAGP